MRISRTTLSSAMFLSLSGCARSPTIDVVGSYFPAWMACIIIGIAATVIVRLLLIGFGIHPHIRVRPVVFTCMGICFTLVAWLAIFRN